MNGKKQLAKKKKRKKYTHHPYCERQKVVELYQSGLGSKLIARQLGLDDSMVRKWLRCYKAYGLEALRPVCRRPLKNVHEQLGRRYAEALQVYATSPETLAAVSRRFGLKYHSFRYFVRRYYPELAGAQVRKRGTSE